MMRILFFAVLCALSSAAQINDIINATVETRAATAGLLNQLRSIAGPAWAAYEVPLLKPGNHCGSHNTRRLALEAASTMRLLYRVENNQVVKIEIATPGCEIDAGGLPLVSLTGVSQAESMRALADLAREERLADSALASIAFHQDPSATAVLERFLDAGQPDKTREKAVFWLSVQRGAYTRVLETARADKSAHVRKQAIFWLAQASQKKLALEALSSALANDPDESVKKQAVFALSQIPNGEGVPQLINVARTNRNPGIRKQAVFWLGQSHDPRALQFFEQVLTQ